MSYICVNPHKGRTKTLVEPLFVHFYFSLFLHFFFYLFVMENRVKMLEKMILTTELGAKHLFVGCNTQQEFSTLGSFGSIFFKIFPQDYTIILAISQFIYAMNLFFDCF